MSSEKPTKVAVKRAGSQFRRNVLSKWPVLVWIGVAFLTWSIYRQGTNFERINGIVYAEHESVAPLETGRLVSVELEKGDRVRAGQTVAKMDTSVIKSEIQQFKVEYEIARLERRRRFETNLADAADRLAEAETQSKATAKQHELAQATLDEMEAKPEGTFTAQVLGEARSKAAALKIEADNVAARVGQLQLNREGAQNLLDELLRLDPEKAAEESTQYQYLQKRLENCELKAERSGIVASVLHQPGEVVGEGNPVLTIVTHGNKQVRGLVLEKNATEVEKGNDVWIAPIGDRQKYRTGSVLAISPTITAFPDPGSPISGAMIRGREIVISLPENDALIPGQSVIIHLKEPGKFDLWSLGKPNRKTAAE